MEKSLVELLSLKGKVAIVTGAASGIGRATAIRMAEAGADLILLDVDEGNLRKTKEELERFGTSVSIYRVDLSSKKEIDVFWEKTKNNSPDILINNAGIFPFEKFENLNEGFYRKVMAVNLDSVVWMCQNFIKLRGNRGGVIINVASIEALLPFMEDLAHYTISKAGIIALTRALAREYGKKGYRINVVIPGGIMTKGVKWTMKEVLKGKIGFIFAARKFMDRLPLKRFGKPDEVARVMVFLASDMASYVHGAVLSVDGGFLSA